VTVVAFTILNEHMCMCCIVIAIICMIGKLIVDCATLSPERMIHQAEQIAARYTLWPINIYCTNKSFFVCVCGSLGHIYTSAILICVCGLFFCAFFLNRGGKFLEAPVSGSKVLYMFFCLKYMWLCAQLTRYCS